MKRSDLLQSFQRRLLLMKEKADVAARALCEPDPSNSQSLPVGDLHRMCRADAESLPSFHMLRACNLFFSSLMTATYYYYRQWGVVFQLYAVSFVS